MTKKIGAYEVRTHWSEIMQEVKRGERFIITHHGEAVAQLSPSQPEASQTRSREAARKMLAFMGRQNPIDVDIKTAIAEGRD